MKQNLKNLIIFILTFTALTASADFIYLKPPTFFERVVSKIKECHIKIPCYFQTKLGADFTTIASSNQISAFPAIYNTNLSQTANTTTPNTFSSLQQFTRASSTQFSAPIAYFGGTATSTFNTAGALTLITPLTTANGGTGSTTLSSNQVLLGNSTGAINVVSGFGSSGQTLQSQGAGVAPQWAANTTDQAANYVWTGTHTFNSFSNFLTASSTNLGVYDILSVGRTSTTTIRGNGISSTIPYASSTAISVSGSASTTDLVVSGVCDGCINNGSGSGYQRITGTCALDTASPSVCSSALVCPTGKTAISGGWSGTEDAAALVSIQIDSFPSATTTWTIEMEGPNGGSETLTTYAVCLRN